MGLSFTFNDRAGTIFANNIQSRLGVFKAALAGFFGNHSQEIVEIGEQSAVRFIQSAADKSFLTPREPGASNNPVLRNFNAQVVIDSANWTGHGFDGIKKPEVEITGTVERGHKYVQPSKPELPMPRFRPSEDWVLR